MDKITIKRHLKKVERDVKYYTEEYNLNQKEAYEILYEQYYICMRLVQSFVEVETREKIHNMFKHEKIEEEGEKK